LGNNFIPEFLTKKSAAAIDREAESTNLLAFWILFQIFGQTGFFCQFYQNQKDLTDILVPYFKAGLENNEFCMWITAQPLDVPEAKKAMTEAEAAKAKISFFRKRTLFSKQFYLYIYPSIF
jgi:hypothetical protein